MVRIHRSFCLFMLVFAGVAGVAAQQPPTTQIASLRPDQQLLWRRVSPTAQHLEGPVLYQIIFRSSAAPNHIPKVSNTHTLVDSLLTDDGSQVAVGGLAIGSTGVISFANGQSFPGTVSGISAGDRSIAIGGSSFTPTVSVAANGITIANIADAGLSPAKITGTAATLAANTFTGDQRVGSNITLNAVRGSIFASSAGFGDTASGTILSANQFGQGRAIYGTTFDGSNANPAIQGESHSNVGTGVVGINTDQGHTGGVGVQGSTQSPSGFGAIGDARFASGTSVGLEGLAAAGGTAGVFNNTAGGKVLSGQNNGREVFSVDGIGSVQSAGAYVTGVSPQRSIVSSGFYVAQINAAQLSIGPVGCESGFLGLGVGTNPFNCTNYSLVSNGTQTILNAPAGGLVALRISNNDALTVDSSGNVHVVGTLTKGGGSFKIDHPLDPGNKYLYHSFVESPDMMNIYNGNVVLDGNGEAVITLPDWFGALNRDFRYQLTAMGAPGPNLYIAEEIANNRFKVAGGTPGGKVSWQVTGIRQDAYANAHRIPVEQDKPEAEKGTYLHPELFGAPPEQGLGALHGPSARTLQKQ